LASIKRCINPHFYERLELALSTWLEGDTKKGNR